MKVNYTLPGLLSHVFPAPPPEFREHLAEPFGAKLRRSSVPESTDWRVLLRLNAPSAGAAGIGPPPAPAGIEARDGTSQRAWWRGMLAKHVRMLESASPPATPSAETVNTQPLRRMVALLLHYQRLEDEVFARHLAERGD